MTTHIIAVSVPADLSASAFARLECNDEHRFSMLIVDDVNKVVNRVSYDKPVHDYIVVFATEVDEALKRALSHDNLPIAVEAEYGIHCPKLCEFLDLHRLAYVSIDGKLPQTITVHRGDTNRI